jgi:hypothetical protein
MMEWLRVKREVTSKKCRRNGTLPKDRLLRPEYGVFHQAATKGGQISSIKPLARLHLDTAGEGVVRHVMADAGRLPAVTQEIQQMSLVLERLSIVRDEALYG